VQILGAVQEQFPQVPAVGPERLGEMAHPRRHHRFRRRGAGAETGKPPTVTTMSRTRTAKLAETVDVRPVPVGLVELPPVDQLEQPYRPGSRRARG